MNSIVFNKQQGGLERPLAGEDQISGLIVYSAATLPDGFTTSAREKVVYSIQQAEGLGIADADDTAILHYHISEFFRMQPQGELWLGIYAVPSGIYDFNEIVSLQNTSGGRIRQVGVFLPQVSFTSTFEISSTDFKDSVQIAALQTKATALATDNKPLIVLYAPHVPTTTALTDLHDLVTNGTADCVSVVIGQDGAAKGNALYIDVDNSSKSISCIGAILGAVSASRVSDNIGWIGKFKFSDGQELETLKFSNGVAYNSLTENDLTGVSNKGYIFLRKHVGISGSYANDSHTATKADSDYAYIENQRTIQKAIRTLRTYLLPALSGPLTLKTDGTLNNSTAAYYETLCQRGLDQMLRDGEISAYKANVNPAQNVLSSSTLVVGILIVPVGVARQIEVNIGFTLSIN
jgi:hypothetical protein